VVGGTIDIGAYEFQAPGIGEFTAWLQQYGLPASGSADYVDSDRDGVNNWQEWIAGTNPTNALSVLKMLPPVYANGTPGLLISWESVNTREYYLESSTNLISQPAFTAIQSNIVGQAGMTTYLDTNAVGAGPYFYQVGVQ
jgi:cytochrome b